MLNKNQSLLAELISLRTIETKGSENFNEHSHPFLEFTLVTTSGCSIVYPPGKRPTKQNTLFHYRENEVHGAACTARQRPRFWVVHFRAADEFIAPLDRLTASDPADRVWALTPEQAESFRWIFLKMLNEQSMRRGHREAAASAWLQLLLITVQRWADQTTDPVIPLAGKVNPEVLRLWHLVNEAVSKPNDELSYLYSAPNYDSTRHAFRKTFGCSPREMLYRLRMEHAKNLLLETDLSIKEIAHRVGYFRQHEFNRMFHRYAGIAPSHWRADPFARAHDPLSRRGGSG